MAVAYPPIEAYGAIGNLRSVALVSRDGSVDWCCFPHLESPSVFASLLDRARGGRFSVAPALGRGTGQRYLEHTNILETVFETDRGRLVVTDFMPLAGSIDGCGGSRAEDAIYRIVRAEAGPVDIEVEWAPRLDYGRADTLVERAGSGFVARAGGDALHLTGLPEGAEVTRDRVGPIVRARFTIEEGGRRTLVTAWGAGGDGVSAADAEERLRRTRATWRDWVHKEEATGERAWAGDWSEQVIRSELVLKLLTHADTGAIAAAATTSLPEEIGGVRNWDYRLTWIRDAALTAQALFALGHRPDAEAFIAWAERAARDEGQKGWGLQIAYGLHGQEDLTERELVNLEGYRRSAPVRIGNAAGSQLQLDIYGELVAAAYELIRLGGELEPEILEFLPRVADQACEAWQRPDFGIWELRNGPFHLVYSKAMVWVALDRAVRMAEAGLIEGNTKKWRRSRSEVAKQVLERGFDPELGAFKQAYERSVPDASNVRIALLELLPPDDFRVQGTLDCTLEHLTEKDLVYRYRADDGVAGFEGAFGSCTFWLVDALALSGRLDEAYALFEGMLGRRNHLGLYSEEIDPHSGAFLGNFPQAYMHVGLITSSLYLADAEGRELPVPSLIGSRRRIDERKRDGAHT
jgi:GH15 family glucan-1,4-alpha-glucosidase